MPSDESRGQVAGRAAGQEHAAEGGVKRMRLDRSLSGGGRDAARGDVRLLGGDRAVLDGIVEAIARRVDPAETGDPGTGDRSG